VAELKRAHLNLPFVWVSQRSPRLHGRGRIEAALFVLYFP